LQSLESELLAALAGDGLQDEKQKDIQHTAGRKEDRSLVHHATSLAQGWKDSTAGDTPARPHTLALDEGGHSEGPQGKGRTETRAEAKGSEAMSVRAAIYARVSTVASGHSPEMQLRELREYCERRGWTVAGEYVDVGISGAKDKRPQLDRMMGDAHKRRFDGVAVWKFDRFARSVSHLLRALDTFRVLGIEFVSLSESLDTTTPAGRMVFTVLGAVAELERSLIAERVRAGLRNARAKGKTAWPAARIRGYTRDCRRVRVQPRTCPQDS